MREQLIQYVELLFAGADSCEDIKQEILQNTLDRYDDLISEGKVPEAAYRLAISGIGDISEILGTKPYPVSPIGRDTAKEGKDTPTKKLLRAIAVGLYIISFLPLFILSEIGMETIGLCGTLCIVAIATVLIILGAKKEPAQSEAPASISDTPQQELRKSIHHLVWAIGLVSYFLVSFISHAWYITWVIFPLTGAVQGLVNAIMDLKEASRYEN